MYCLHIHIAWHDKAWARFVLGCIGLVFTKQSTRKADKACAAMRLPDVQYCWSGMTGGCLRGHSPRTARPHYICVK